MELQDFLTDNGKWHCTECGACCKLMHLVPKLTFLNRGDNVCVHLNRENKCNVYESRPDECRGEVVFGPDHDPVKRARMCYLLVHSAAAYHRGEYFALPGY